MADVDARGLDCSIVIPAWNAQSHISAAISAALAQRDLNFEVIVVDDASQDATAQTVSAILDPRVTLISRPVNGGAGAARNDAFAAAKGRWISVLDADDDIKPDRLSALIKTAEQQTLDVVADNLIVMSGDNESLHICEDLDGSTQTIDLKMLFLEALTFRDGAEYGYLKPLFRRDFLRAHTITYDETLRVGEDFQLLAECLARGARFGRVRSAGYIYRRISGSTSHRLKPGHLAAVAAADTLFLKRFGDLLSPEATLAVRQRLKSAQDGEAFVMSVEQLKQRQWLNAALTLLKQPAAVGFYAIPIRDRWRRRQKPKI